MPVAALIDDKIFCVHGGLSPELNKLDQLKKFARPMDIPNNGMLCDILWSDPSEECNTWMENERGVSFVFSKEILSQFISKNSLDLVVRAHQVVEEGYEFFAGRQLVTVFSAPDYCGEYNNAAGMMVIEENLLCSFKVLKPVNDLS